MLQGKKVLLGVTASIAAYKTAHLIRLLVKSGAEVKVIMTPASKDFITPLTLSTLSKHPVFSDYFDPESGEWNNHVDFGGWPDVFLIAPVTANTISKMANGNCDNLLLATYLSAKCPVLYAPAMDLDMYKHPTTTKNINTLSSYGNTLIPPGKGELASGLEGEGRMAEPEEMVQVLNDYFAKDLPLKNKKVLITAGPTYENIDPVRFIGNRSSGKMGYAIATKAISLGADVVLVSGPSKLKHPEGAEVVGVQSADEMYTACMANTDSDIIIMSAAVSDYKVKNQVNQKIKKKDRKLAIDLVPTKDILKKLGELKKKKQLLIGFALETNDEIKNATEKLKRKNLDAIILNSLNDAGAGFDTDTNKVTIIDRNNKKQEIELKEKSEVAADIMDKIIELL